MNSADPELGTGDRQPLLDQAQQPAVAEPPPSPVGAVNVSRGDNERRINLVDPVPPPPPPELVQRRSNGSPESFPNDHFGSPAAPGEDPTITSLSFPDVNEDKICFFKFNDEYTDVERDEFGCAAESPQDDFIDPLPPLPITDPDEGRDNVDPIYAYNPEPNLEPSERNINFRAPGKRFNMKLEDEREDFENIKRHLRRPRYGLPVGKLPFGTSDVVDMETYTSLNYGTSSCQYKTDHDDKCLRRGKSISPSFVAQFFVAVAVGVTTGLMGFAINVCIDWISKPKYVKMSETIEGMGDGTEWSLFHGILVICGLNVGLCTVAAIFGFISPVSTGSGIPHIKTYLNGVKIPEMLHFKTLVCKFFGVVFSVAGGMPVGKEGPMIHSGAVIGAGLSQGQLKIPFWKRLPAIPIFDSFRNDVTKREFVAVGSAAGVAAAFGAPLGGVLFVVEEGGSFLDAPMIALTLVGAGSSFLTLNLLQSLSMSHFGDLGSKGLLSFGSFDDSKSSYNLLDLIVFAIVGAGCGFLGAVFNHINEFWTKFRMRNFKRILQRQVEVLVVSFAVTMVALACMLYVNDCHIHNHHESRDIIQLDCPLGYYHSGAAIWFATPESVIKDLLHSPMETYTFKTLFYFTVAYFLCSVFTYGLPISSGLFIPCLLTGAGIGRIVGMGLQVLMPFISWGSLSMYSLMGACGMLTGVVRISICICAILTEATGNHLLGFPILLTAVAAKLTADKFNEGIYEIHNDLAGVPYLNWSHTRGSEVVLAKNIMSFPVHCFEMRECVSDVFHFIINYPHRGIPIVEKRNSWTSNKSYSHDGKLLGIVLKEDVLTMLKLRMFDFYPGERRELDQPLPDLSKRTWKDIRSAYPHYFRLSDIRIPPDLMQRTFIDFSKIMDPDPSTCGMLGTLASVFQNFRASGLRHMIVVNQERQVKGMITRKDIFKFMSHNSARVYGSRTPQMGKKTQVVKSKNYWIVLRRY